LIRLYCSHYFWYVSEIAGYENSRIQQLRYFKKDWFETLQVHIIFETICTKINGVRETRQMFHLCKRNHMFYKVFFFFCLRFVCCPNGCQFFCFVRSWISLSGFSNVYGIENKWLYLYIFSLIFTCYKSIIKQLEWY
jgi:hypothetical protein